MSQPDPLAPGHQVDGPRFMRMDDDELERLVGLATSEDRAKGVELQSRMETVRPGQSAKFTGMAPIVQVSYQMPEVDPVLG